MDKENTLPEREVSSFIDVFFINELNVLTTFMFTLIKQTNSIVEKM